MVACVKHSWVCTMQTGDVLRLDENDQTVSTKMRRRNISVVN